MLVRDIMKTRVSSIRGEDTALTAARRMRDERIGCLPVTENGRLVGIVTDRDLVVRCMAEDTSRGRPLSHASCRSRPSAVRRRRPTIRHWL